MCVCLQNTQRHLKTKLRETDDGTGRRFFGRSFFFFEEREKDSLSPPRPPTHNARALPQNRTKPLIFKRKRERETFFSSSGFATIFPQGSLSFSFHLLPFCCRAVVKRERERVKGREEEEDFVRTFF